MYFSNPNTWFGGYYELALELGERSDERLLNPLAALWSHPSLEGCYLERDKESHEQERVVVSPGLLERTHLQGLAQLPDGRKVACGSCVIREDEGIDWLDFYLPMGALEAVYDVGGYPFDEAGVAHKEWQIPVDGWLKEIGNHIFSTVPFRLGLVGFEVSGIAYSQQIEKDGIPSERCIAYLWNDKGKLEWHPTNTWAPA